jgi:hypothetical protein
VNGGPFVIPSSVKLDEASTSIEMTVSDALAGKSILPENISFSVFDAAAGWSSPALTPPAYDNTTHKITVKYTAPLVGSLVRLIVRGTGPTPVLGANLVPLGNGVDFIFTQKR